MNAAEKVKLLQSAKPLKMTPLTMALGVNALTVCDCGATAFKVGLAYNPETENNFIRAFECVACGKQMAATHQSDTGLAPSLGLHKNGERA